MRRWSRAAVCSAGLALAWPQPASAQLPAFQPRPYARQPAASAVAPSATKRLIAAPSNPAPAPAQAKAPPVEQDPLVQWRVLGRSFEGRVIEYVQFGTGQHPVLVIGSLRGDEPEGVALAQSLASHLARFPRRLEDVTVTIVRDPNPDGRARRQGNNARNVDLDRNFLTATWRKVNGAPSGAGQPESEPETRALVELLADVKPERIVLLGTTNSRASVTFTGPADALAAQVAIESGAQLVPIDPNQQSGAFLVATGIDQGIPTLRLGVTPRATADEIWSVEKRALMTSIGCGSPLPFVPIPGRAVAGNSASPPSGPRHVPATPTSARPYAPPAAVDPFLAGQMRQGAPSGAINSGEAPQVIPFDDLSHGRPTVQVTSPRRLRPTVAAPQYAAPAAANDGWQSAASAIDPRVQRLPPIDAFLPSSYPTKLPQQPIPVYPSTGK